MSAGVNGVRVHVDWSASNRPLLLFVESAPKPTRRAMSVDYSITPRRQVIGRISINSSSP